MTPNLAYNMIGGYVHNSIEFNVLGRYIYYLLDDTIMYKYMWYEKNIYPKISSPFCSVRSFAMYNTVLVISVSLSYSRIRKIYCLYCKLHKPTTTYRLPAIYIVRHNIVIADYGLVTINEGSADASRYSTYIYITNKPERYCR